MVELQELKKIYIMQRLTDPMLEKIRPLVSVRRYNDRDVVFREGEEATEFFILYSGLILLEVSASPIMDITIGTIKPGYSFGWSALMQPPAHYTTHAISSGASEVFT
ncbi:MAG: cyclic nucleotide-binding domain-containing protein, partial [Desulfatiglandales bacterium]